MEDTSLRYAHNEGHTDVCYDDSGQYLFTHGTDGDVRMWEGFDDDDPVSHHIGDQVSSIAFKNGTLYVASDAFSVSSYAFPSITFERIVAQYNTAVYHIVCSSDGKLVASGGGDFLIKVFDTTEKILNAFRGHDGPILSLCFDPEQKYLASSSCDGTLKIWNLSDQECIKTLNLFKKCNDFCTATSLCRLDWSPNGEFLAVPVDIKVCFYARNTWDCMFSFTDPCLEKTLSLVTYSPFGNYIAAGAINGQMLVWDVEKKNTVSRKKLENEVAISGLKWHPSGKDLAFCDVEGHLGLYEAPLSSSSSDKETQGQDFIDSAADEINFGDDDDGGDDENEFDIGAIKATLEPKIFGTDNIADSESVKSEVVEPKIKIIEAPKAPVQTAFQPSSTPVSLERRFMLWNSVGVVRCYNTDEENSIDVEFHDSNIHHPLHLNNVKNHTMAALSNEGLLLASPKVDDNSSKLECMHFGSWDSNKDWTLEMPKNEEIEAIAVSDDWAACVTDKRLVHLFTISGIQCEVFSIPGAVVCCSARNKQLSIVYHKGSGVEDNQCFNLLLVDVELGGNSRIKDYAVPLTSKAFLSWLGYTDEGHPCIVDTAGIISLLSPNCGSKWIPVANTAQNLKGRSDTYFVIGLSEIKQEIRCILCKGSKYPALLPRPTISVIPFSLPFCEIDTDRGKLEEENARCSLMHKSIQSLLKEGFDLDTEYRAVEKQWMDVLLKMFALATRMDRDCRALDIARLMPNTVIIQGAIRYATQRHKITLAERLSEVMNEKLLESSRIEDDEVELSSPEKSFVSPELPHLKHRSRNYNEEDDVILKPKPLSHVRNESSKSEGFEETMEAGNIKSNETSDLMKDTVSKSSPVSNPFKRSSKGKELRKEELSRQNGIDDIFHNSMKTLAAKANSHTPKDEKQSKKSRFSDHKKEKTQNQESIKPKVGFQLFLDENREKIRTSAESELSEAEIVRTAMKLYKELPPSDKQKYASTANKESTNKAMNGEVPDINNSAVLKDKTEVLKDSEKAVSKKRKENSDDTENNKTEKVKKVKSNEEKLSQTTVNKLTQFAFTRTPK